jgi:hypothetical protein
MDNWKVMVGVTLLVIAAEAAAFTAGRDYERGHAVCHAATEDSTITGCDYHDGGWWRA